MTFNLVAAIVLMAGTAPGAEPPALFPSIPGWTLSPDSTVYTPDNLWNLIDGAADAFLGYGFLDLHVAEYMNVDSIDVRAELYRHSSSINAFGIYSQERKPEYSFIDMGAQGYIEDGVLNFLDGDYYVKLTSHRMGPQGREALLTIAKSLVSSLHQKASLPAELGLFPAEGKVTNGESYVGDSYLGYSFFHSAFVAQYAAEGGFQMFIMDLGSPGAARAALERYWKTIKQQPAASATGTYQVADPNNGPLIIILSGKHLGGIMNYRKEETGKAYIAKLRASLGA